MNKEYSNEVKNRWGATASYKEYSQKSKTYSKDEWQKITEGLNNLLQEFAKAKEEKISSSSSKLLELVQKLKEYISEYYYNCTNEILIGLGQMYMSDERFKNNIDKYGEGTAEFIKEAIDYYCMRDVTFEG